MDIVSIDGGYFSYKDTEIFKEIDLKIEKNSFICLLGPNGIGKSTLVKIILGELELDRGNITNNAIGKNFKFENISILSDEVKLHHYLTVEEVLAFSFKAFDKTVDQKIIINYLKKYNLLQHRSKLVKHLSTGLKRRLEIAQCLVNDSQLIVVDEPTNGLDLNSARDIIALINTIFEEDQKTVLYITHQLHEIEKYYKKIIFIKDKTVEEYPKECIESKHSSLTDLYQKIYFSGDRDKNEENILNSR